MNRRLVECRCIAANVIALFERTWYTPGLGYSVDFKVGTFTTNVRTLAVQVWKQAQA